MSILKSELKTPKLVFKNRLIMPPMATAMSDDDGGVNDAILNYYDEKTKGGDISFVILEHAFIKNCGRARQKQISVENDSDVVGLSKIAELIHKNGSLCAMQINHAGSAADEGASKEKAEGPSEIAHPRTKTVPRELTKEDIKNIVEKFGQAAKRCKEAGFDAVEIHSAHGYLLNQFYSSYSNKRTDEYGGNIDGRIKMHLEVIKAVKEAVGEDYPVFIRLGVKDYGLDGATVEDGVYACKAFEKAGVDVIDITAGLSGYVNPENDAPGYFKELSTPVKLACSVPVILTGGVKTAEDAEKLLEEKACDLVGVGRALLADSDWARNEMNK